MPEEGRASDMDGSKAASAKAVPWQRLYPEVQHCALEGHHMLCVNLHDPSSHISPCLRASSSHSSQLYAHSSYSGVCPHHSTAFDAQIGLNRL